MIRRSKTAGSLVAGPADLAGGLVGCCASDADGTIVGAEQSSAAPITTLANAVRIRSPFQRLADATRSPPPDEIATPTYVEPGPPGWTALRDPQACGMPYASEAFCVPRRMSQSVLKIEPIAESLSLKARAYRALKAAIMDMNIYAADAELRLDERDLSLRFGISRTPLREALAQLEQEGLVRIAPRRGIFIVRKTKAEILDMITVWAALESMAARLAAGVATKRELATLHGLVDNFRTDEVAQRMGEYSDANIRFHQTIIGLGQNPLIGEITDSLFLHVRAIRQRTIFEADRARRSIADHTAIVAAIEASDADRAERLVREHTLKLRDHVDRHVSLD